jgi:tripartite-type tricarboxylate transporter receptor subunit TctC
MTGGLLIGCLSGARARPPDYPERTVRLVAPFAAGGLADTLARLLATALSQTLRQAVLVDNIAGASGTIGADAVARAPADGHTLLLAPPAPLVQAPFLFSRLPYDPRSAFAFISDVADARVVLVVHPSLPVSTFSALLQHARAHPAALSMGSWGIGTHPHLVQALMERSYGAPVTHVPYKGEALMLTDLVGGHLSMACSTVALARPHLAAGRLRAIAMLGPSRAAALPDVPTFAEAGYRDGVLQLAGPLSLVAPAGTPGPIVLRLASEVQAIVGDAQVARRLLELGLEPVGSSPAQALHGFLGRLAVVGAAMRDAGVVAN